MVTRRFVMILLAAVTVGVFAAALFGTSAETNPARVVVRTGRSEPNRTSTTTLVPEIAVPATEVPTPVEIPPRHSTSSSSTAPVVLLPPLVVEQSPPPECVGSTWEHGTCTVPANVVPDPHLPYGWPVEVRRYYCMDFEAPVADQIPPDGWYPFPPTQPVYKIDEEACP